MELLDRDVFCKRSLEYLLRHCHFMHPDQERIYIVLVTGIAVLLTLVVILVVAIIGYHRKKSALHLKNAGGHITSLDAERERIAADLHDDFGASLSNIKVRLQCIRSGDPETLSIIKFSKGQIDEAMKKLRRISVNMIPDAFLEKGLDQALQELLEVMTNETGIAVTYSYKAPAFNMEKATHIYRIVQEILNNTVKHAGATGISFDAYQVKSKVILHYTDDGRGFNKDMIRKDPRGFGLKNVMSRAAVLHANVYITTAPGQGADYFIEIPVS
jgi:two-component system NarL family sensor kinase